MPLLQIRFPSNIMSVLVFTKPIALFDPLDGTEGTKFEVGEWQIWNPDDTSYEDQQFHDQMGEVGFESLNAFENLGSVSFFLLLWLFKAVTTLILYLLMKYSCCLS
jgi:hypothetical protein